MKTPIFQVDAFTDVPFRGNPAAVCVLSEPYRSSWMQSVAAEMNLAETAFLVRRDDGYELRWFTPTVEVDLCGHATLASAHVLWETGELTGDTVARFQTRSGLLTARREGDWITLDFPAVPESQVSVPPGLEDALGITGNYVGKNQFDYLVQVESEKIVRALVPDFVKLKTLPARGIIVTALSDTPGVDFVSRFFAPASGVDEDPVTGSAHCCLAPFWAARLGKTQMTGYQASKRGGSVNVRVEGERVHLGGQAVTVLRGELWVATHRSDQD